MTMTVTITTRLPTDTPAIVDLLKARENIVARLQQSPDYRALVSLDGAIRQLRESVTIVAKDESETTPSAPPSAPLPASGTGPDKPTGVLAGYSHANGAYKAFRDLKRPMTIAELVSTLAANGLVVGGSDPHVNLSSTLSKDDRFESVRWNGRRCWWLRGVSLAEV